MAGNVHEGIDDANDLGDERGYSGADNAEGMMGEEADGKCEDEWNVDEIDDC